jgi:ABC-type amino acid transport substrate-binding protein
MKKIWALITLTAVLMSILVMAGCSDKKQNADESDNSVKTKYNIETAEGDVTKYHIAFNSAEVSVIKNVYEAYSHRYSSEELNLQAEKFFGEKDIICNLETYAQEPTDKTWDDILQNGTLNIGVIKNNKFAFADEEGNAGGYFMAVSKLICMDAKVKSNIILYDNEEDALNALKTGEISFVIGTTGDAASDDITLSSPVVEDNFVVISDKSTKDGGKFYTLSQYKNMFDTTSYEGITELADIEDCVLKVKDEPDSKVIVKRSDVGYFM